MTVPIENSILYVEPIYVTAGKNTFPELKMVVAVYDSKIAIRPTLDEAVAALFPVAEGEVLTDGETASSESAPSSKDTSQLVESINPIEQMNPENADVTDVQKITEAFRQVQEASKTNDWEAFGKAMNDLEIIINELNGIEGEAAISDEASSQ